MRFEIWKHGSNEMIESYSNLVDAIERARELRRQDRTAHYTVAECRAVWCTAVEPD